MTQRKMKDSGIEWIGEIPEEWEIGKIRYYFTIICGATPKSDELKYWNGNINWITPAEMSESNKIITESIRKITAAGYQSCGTELIPKNSLILSTRAPIGQVCISGCELCTNQGCKSLKIRTANTNYEYYYYYLTIQSAIFNMLGRGTTFMELSTTDLSDYIIPVPSIGEQQTIADYLDKKCAAIDKAIEAEKQIIEKLKIYKQSVITDAVTKGLDKNAKMKPSGIDWIGEIPEEWKKSHIKYCSDFEPYCDVTSFKSDDIVTCTPMECIRSGEFENREGPFSSYNSSYTPYEENDIAFAKVTPCFENGNIAIMKDLHNGFGYGSSELFIIRARAIETKFLFYWLQNTIFKQQACATMTGVGGLKRVSPDFVRNCPLFIPSEDEQKKIIDFLEDKCNSVNTTIMVKTQIVDKLKQYKKSLIYESVTGKREICHNI